MSGIVPLADGETRMEKLVSIVPLADGETRMGKLVLTDEETRMEEEYKLAKKLYDEKKYAQSLPILIKLANLGHANAQNLLGFMYQYGFGVSKDYKEALRLFELSVSQGWHQAENNLGYMYEQGIGVPQDFKRAYELYKLSADHGNSSGAYNLASAYWLGRGTNKNLSEALRWFRTSLINDRDKVTIINHILEIISKESLADILISEHKLREENKSLHEKITQLEEHNERLQTEIDYRPDGIGYIKAKEEFEELAKSTE